MTITRIGGGMFRVEHDGRNEIVYVTGPVANRWIFWNGQVYRGDFRPRESGPAAGPEAERGGPFAKRAGPYEVRPTTQALTAPMPARVSKILVQAGARVRKGDTVIVLEAMKMELPVRAPADAVVAAVHCREGELVQADAVLIDLK